MALQGRDIRRAVWAIDDDPTTETTGEDLVRALRLVLPLLERLLADIPWWRKVILGVGVLVDAIREYLGEA